MTETRDVLADTIMLAMAAAAGDKAPFWAFDGSSADELRELVACQARPSATLAAVIADGHRAEGLLVGGPDVLLAARDVLLEDDGRRIA